MEKIRVLLVDDHTLFREGVRLLLQGSGIVDVVGEACNGQESVTLTQELLPDIVIMDITMPVMNGLEATQEIRKKLPSIKILTLTMHESVEHFFQVLKAGSSGYVLKEAAGTDLVAAIKAVHRGDVFIYPSVAKVIVDAFMKQRNTDGKERLRYENLTDREKEILLLISEGLTNQEIADRLYLSINTIQTHRNHIMTKLNLHNRAELMRSAIMLGDTLTSSQED